MSNIRIERCFVYQYGVEGFLCDQQAISEYADLVVFSH